MASDLTPGRWPVNGAGGVMDEAVGSVSGSGMAARAVAALRQWLAPAGRVRVELAAGKALSLEGARLARVECLGGDAWVTGECDGRDLRLASGERAEFPLGGQVVVVARGQGASVRLWWK